MRANAPRLNHAKFPVAVATVAALADFCFFLPREKVTRKFVDYNLAALMTQTPGLKHRQAFSWRQLQRLTKNLI
jgi:hypothetical protein